MIYKIEVLDEKNLCWTPIQKTFDSLKDVKKHLPKNQESRIMANEGKKYFILNTK